MATAKQQSDFIQAIAPIVIKYAKQFGYKNVSGTIAQACLESAYGTCALSKYFNFFGLATAAHGFYYWKAKAENLRKHNQADKVTMSGDDDQSSAGY